MAKHKKTNQTQRKNSKDKENQKTLVKSVRMSENQYKAIKKKADDNELSFGSYIVKAATLGTNSITPELAVSVQNVVNIAHNTIKEHAPDKLEEIEREVNALWSLLN